MNLGYDYIIIETDQILSVLKTLKKHQLTLFHLKQIDASHYSFYVPIYQRPITYQLHLPIVKSIGVFHYLLCLFHIPQIYFTLGFTFTLFLLPHYLYRIEIKGNLPQVTQQLEQVLHQDISFFHQKLSYKQINQLYDQIKSKYQKKIDYLNIYQNGSVLHVEYTPASLNQETVLKYQDYIAKKDGVISKIDVQQGNVLVRVNQFVKKGDILISHEIEDTSQKIKIIPTLGRIEGYTYQTIEASCKDQDSFAYLLFKIRSQLPKDVKIDQEKVLSYGIIGKKYVLKMHYVFIENIAIREET